MGTNVFKSESKLVRHIISRLLQRVGLYKPPTKPLTPQDELWLFNNTAFRSTQDTSLWEAEFVACYFRLDSGDKTAAIVADIIEKLGIAKGEEVERRVKERVELFLNLIQPGRTVEIEFDAGEAAAAREVGEKSNAISEEKSLPWPPSWWPGGRGKGSQDPEPPKGDAQRLTLGPSENNGISSDIRTIPSPSGNQKPYSDGYIASSAALLPKGYGTLNGFETMRTIFGEPTGWGVISDIDDTIKVTKVLSRTEILRHTFFLPTTPVPGMSAWYNNSIAPVLKNPLWFYVTASPYNLYPMLDSFLRESNYPKGTLILRDMSWQELETFIYLSLTVGTQEYKVDRISKIHSWFPNRKMILIGDSTQKDPEVYGECYRKFGNEWVKGIFIRVVKGVDGEKEEELNKMERFEKAFEGAPGEGDDRVWWLFEEPQQMEGMVERLVERDESRA